MNIKKKIQLFKEFGFLVGFSSACSSAIRFPMAITRWKDHCILRWLKKHYSDVILKYKKGNIPSLISVPSSIPAPIWSVWWQGEENAPEIVKMCFASVNQHRGEHPFRIITKDNYQEYISLPEHVVEKVLSGVITLTHLSDIIRLYLLSHYGGLWLDATILVMDDIPETIFNSKYYIIRHELNPNSYGVNLDRWISFLQAAKKGNLLCGFAYDLLCEYWKERTSLIDYMLIDYAIELVCEELPECRELLDSVPLNNRRVDELRPLLNCPWNPSVLEDLKTDTLFFKLTWKHKFYRTISGHETIYGHLVNIFLN